MVLRSVWMCWQRRPRTLTSAVLERLRADILSTRLVPARSSILPAWPSSFRSASRRCAKRCRGWWPMAGAGLGPARLSGQPGVAGRPRGCHAHPHRHRGPDAAPLDRARRSGMAGFGGGGFRGAQRRSLSPAGRPGDPQRGVDRPPPRLPPRAGRCLRLAVAARFRDILHEQSERYAGFRSAAKPANSATSKPNTPRSWMPCCGATRTPPSRR